MSNLIGIILFFLAGILVYGFRRRIMEPLHRFEARNARRRAEEARALFDNHAHYRQTVQFAEEEIEDVTKITVPDGRTGEPVTRYLFLGEHYGTRTEAEAARFTAVIEKAREFYKDLDRIYLARGHRARASMENPPPNRTRHDA
jgi:hypothetical protein